MLSKRDQKLAYKLLFPTFLIIFIIAFYPLGQVFYTSFTNKSFASINQKTEFVGLYNYKKLLSITIKNLPQGSLPIDILPNEPIRYKELLRVGKYVIGAADPNFIKAVFNTIIFTILSVFLETIIGLFIALVVNSKFKGQGMMRTVMLIPWAIITVVSARIWEYMFVPTRTGFFNALISKLSFGEGHVPFLAMDKFQLPAIVAVDVWKTSPFMTLILLAGLQLIPEDLYKAADVDGAGKVRKFFLITLPLLKPSLAVALVFRTLDSLRVFDVFQVLLANKKYSMATYNYEQLINYRNMGLASAIGVIIFFIIGIFAVSYIRTLAIKTE